MITGDSPQALIGNLTESDAEFYFATRRAQGFNTVWINLLCNNYTACRDDGSTWDGVPPFTTPGDFSTPNEAYFAHVDRVLRLAGAYGLVVLLDPAETGGWLSTMVGSGVDKLRAYGEYLGRRYKDFPNIIWMHGNDYQEWGPTYDPYVTAVALGIRDVDTRHLQTVELNYSSSGSLDDPTWAPIIQLNASYTYFPTYDQVLKDYNRSNFLPTFMVEANYELSRSRCPPAAHLYNSGGRSIGRCSAERPVSSMEIPTRGSSNVGTETTPATVTRAGSINWTHPVKGSSGTLRRCSSLDAGMSSSRTKRTLWSRTALGRTEPSTTSLPQTPLTGPSRSRTCRRAARSPST